MFILYCHIYINTLHSQNDKRFVQTLQNMVLAVQDDEINLQCQLVEKLKQQMLDQDEVRKSFTDKSLTNNFKFSGTK